MDTSAQVFIFNCQAMDNCHWKRERESSMAESQWKITPNENAEAPDTHFISSLSGSHFLGYNVQSKRIELVSRPMPWTIFPPPEACWKSCNALGKDRVIARDRPTECMRKLSIGKDFTRDSEIGLERVQLPDYHPCLIPCPEGFVDDGYSCRMGRLLKMRSHGAVQNTRS